MKPKKFGTRSHGDKNREARENRHVKPVEESHAPSLDEHDLMRIVAETDVPFLLILDCVQDPHNLGAILRTADGAGVHAVVAPKDKAVGITETVRRISVGGRGRSGLPFLAKKCLGQHLCRYPTQTADRRFAYQRDGKAVALGRATLRAAGGQGAGASIHAAPNHAVLAALFT